MERQYSVKYALNDAEGVKALLRDRHRIASRRFGGDMDASCLLIDLHTAMNTANLTPRQAEAIAWVYGADITQSEAAKLMKISQKNVSEYVDIAVQRIAAVYQAWDYGEVSVEMLAEDNEEEAFAWVKLT
jgi:predicted DNA-binding protein (UPF0251 family)